MNEQPLLAAVLASPDDDAPRLIMADFLDEQGQCDRAEFIRQSVASGDVVYFRQRFARVVAPTDGLGNSQAKTGLVGLFLPPGRYDYRRGFVSRVTCSAEDWLRHGDAITAAQPVEEVTLTSLPVVRRRHELLTFPFFWLVGGRRRGKEKPMVRLPTDISDLEATLAVCRQWWPRVKVWNLPPRLGGPNNCRECGAPATRYTQDRLDTTSWYSSGRQEIAGLMTAYCAAHAPAGAIPMPGFSISESLLGEAGTNYSSTAAALERYRRR